LERAHALGFTHRDLKPANLLTLNGQIVVADWGIARNAPGTTAEDNPTRTDLPYGSWGWAAPELSDVAHAATPASDFWSLGQIIGWMFRNEFPNQGVPHIPSGTAWQGVVQACTIQDPAQRPQSTAEFLALVVNEVPIHQHNELIAGVYALADQLGGNQFVQAVKVERLSGHRFSAATWYPSGLTTNHLGDFEAYRRFLADFPGEATRSSLGPPPAAIGILSRSNLLALTDRLSVMVSGTTAPSV
jgi:serine/threonine protein kinase